MKLVRSVVSKWPTPPKMTLSGLVPGGLTKRLSSRTCLLIAINYSLSLMVTTGFLSLLGSSNASYK